MHLNNKPVADQALVGRKIDPDAIYNADTAGRFLGVTARTLRQWRWSGSGPSFIKAGRVISYRGRDLTAWLDGHRVASNTVTQKPRR